MPTLQRVRRRGLASRNSLSAPLRDPGGVPAARRERVGGRGGPREVGGVADRIHEAAAERQKWEVSGEHDGGAGHGCV